MDNINKITDLVLYSKFKRISFDIHGVLDTFNSFDVNMLFKTAFHRKKELYIISGQTINKSITELQSLGIQTKFGENEVEIKSVIDSALVFFSGVEGLDFNKDLDQPYINEDIWWHMKGLICALNHIDVHFDNDLRYRQHFRNTYFVHYLKD